MDISNIVDGLNSAQRDAVTSDHQHQLILAGAGSGKTRVLIHRMAWIIDVLQHSPASILMVTFTNKAARELRHRVESMLNIQPRGMWIGTFHGLSHRLLQMHHQQAGLPNNFQVLDSDDQLRVVKRVIRDMNLDEKRWVPKAAQWFINSQKEEGIRPTFVEVNDFYTQTHQQIYDAYQLYCDRTGVVDFAEILLRSHELLRNNEDILSHYQQRFKHILVDEFQDTNSIQYAWLRLLASNPKIGNSLIVVGDDDQSIYGWRGAKIENILNVQKDFEGTQVIKLEQNYRSTNTILQAANAIISKNMQRLGKDLWTDLGDGDLIDVYDASDEYDEASFIANYLKQWYQTLDQDVDSDSQPKTLRDIAILYRSNAQSRVLEEAMINHQIPYQIYGGQRFYERLEIKNVVAYLRLVVNKNDDNALERVINVPPRGIGVKTMEKCREQAQVAGHSLWQTLQVIIQQQSMSARIVDALESFVAMILSLSAAKDQLTLAELVESVIAQSGLKQFHAAEGGERGVARVENLDELINACENYSKQIRQTEDLELPLLDQFLIEASLDAGEQQSDDNQDAIQMMTLHSAKGLEFPLVIIAGMENNLFPHIMAEQEGNHEEERRLCYVGITRAKHKLLLSYAQSRRLHGQERYNGASPFIRDLPNELVRHVRMGFGVTVNRATQAISQPIGNPEANDDLLPIGQVVSHPVFGVGMIINYEGRGEHLRVEVNFENEGNKWFIYPVARLEPR